MRRTAAQLTPELSMEIPPNPRRLSKRERRLLCRAIDVVLAAHGGFDAESFAVMELMQLREIASKLQPKRRASQ